MARGLLSQISVTGGGGLDKRWKKGGKRRQDLVIQAKL
jgi:hypothetical protein